MSANLKGIRKAANALAVLDVEDANVAIEASNDKRALLEYAGADQPVRRKKRKKRAVVEATPETKPAETKGRPGRPKGSKNKKPAAAPVTEDPAEEEGSD